MTDDRAYVAVRLLADRIIGIYPKVSAARAFYRKPGRPHHLLRLRPLPQQVVTDRDRAFNALAAKAAATHGAICLTLDARHEDAAQALCRVLLENVLLMEWLLLDPVFRLDVYCISPELMKRHFSKVVRDHYSNEALLEAADAFMRSTSRQIVDDVFSDTYYKWAQRIGADGATIEEAITLSQMAKELAAAGGRSASFAYDALYFRLSGSIHSTADVVSSFANTKDDGSFFLSGESVGTSRSITLRSANFFMLSALTALNSYSGLGLEADIDELAEAGKTETGVNI